MIDRDMVTLLGIVAAALLLGTITAEIAARRATSDRARSIAQNLRARMRSWWVMAGVFVVSVAIGGVTTIVLFGISSFLAFREFITLTPTRRGDHRALFWAFFVIIPFQYLLIAQERISAFTVFVPVFVFVIIPARMAAAGEVKDFLTRVSRIQWGLITCVYFISHVPALLSLELEGYDGKNATLLFFFILIVQLNDVFQFVTGKLFGRHKIAPLVSPNKTVEGLLGGLIVSGVVGASLAWATPFSPLAAAGIAVGLAFAGFLGDITMSAVKRDIGVKDYSSLLPGHGGVLDRLDSLTFAAPLFFHLVRSMFSGE